MSNVDEGIRKENMKSYNHLWEEFISEENIKLAIKNAFKGKKKKRRKVREIIENQEEWIPKIKDYAEHFYNYPHKPIEIYDGISRKKRTIIVPTPMEKIVHHMIINVLKLIFKRGMYEHSYASIPKRGSHKGKKYIEKWIKHDARNVKYCLKMDIKKYFQSVDTDILKKKLHRIIHDERFMALLEILIDIQDTGIPLGFFTSQWLANFCLQDLDHYIKEDLGATYYIRYMDDMVIFVSNKRKLHRMKENIEKYLHDELGLCMKENWQIFRFDYTDRKEKRRGRDLDFMGFRFYRDKTTLRKSIMLKATRKAKRIDKKEKITAHDARQILSYMGYIDKTDTYGMYEERIKPYVNVQKCKRKVSKFDKNRKKKEAA